MIRSVDIEKTACFKTEDGNLITVDAGRFAWQIIWDMPEWSYCKTESASADANLKAGIEYLKKHRHGLTETDEKGAGETCGGEC